MPTVKTLCTDETKTRFSALATSEGLTESMLLRRMIAAVVRQRCGPNAALPASETRGGRRGYGGQIKLRLRPVEVRAIRALAEPEGYSAQAWIVHQLRHRLEGAVPFAKEELSAQHDAIRELSAVGRNLNTIAHRLLRSGSLRRACWIYRRWPNQSNGYAVK